eukprot:8138759-Pyramimonas_sp.AAC.1
MLQRLQLREDPVGGDPRNYICIETSRQLARCHLVFHRAIRASCRIHSGCSLMVEPTWFDNPDAVVCEWIALGRIASREQHLSEASRIRASRRARAAA